MITATSTPDGRVNLTLFAGETLRVGYVCRDAAGTLVDLSGYVARCQIRRDWGEAALFSLNGSNGGAIVDSPGTAGRVIIYVSDEATATMDGVYQYGLKLESPTGDELELVGTLTVSPGLAD